MNLIYVTPSCELELHCLFSALPPQFIMQLLAIPYLQEMRVVISVIPRGEKYYKFSSGKTHDVSKREIAYPSIRKKIQGYIQAYVTKICPVKVLSCSFILLVCSDSPLTQ